MTCHFINGAWLNGSGPKFSSRDPALREVVWEGREATLTETDHAVYAARNALDAWSRLSPADRLIPIKTFAKELETHRDALAEAVSSESGKPAWEALTEVSAMIAKIAIAERAFAERIRDDVKDTAEGISATRFKPHGVVAVFGPFNFPGHLANGHIVPALIAGNTVVFKPSELTPLTAKLTIELWEKAGLPPGVIALVQGGKATGQTLANHPGLDGLFFTGSSATGLVLNRLFADRPDKILAIEMGGNTPLVVWRAGSASAAAYLAVQSAFLTAGQRCTCARRLILPEDAEGDDVLDQLLLMTRGLKIGHFRERPEPFMGPVVTPEAAMKVVAEQERLAGAGAKVLLAARILKEGTGLVTPGIVDVTFSSARRDEEVFGPLLQVFRAGSFEEAVDEANDTRYGLAAALVSVERSLWEEFHRSIRAGIINWNRPTTGASSSAPFGGVGFSGNHRPSAYFAADYCSYPVASMEVSTPSLPATLPPGLELP